MELITKKQTAIKYIENGGWICGFIAAVGLNYWVLPRLVFTHGGKFLAGLIGLMLSLVAMIIFVEISCRLADALRITEKRINQKRTEKKSIRIRVAVASVVGILALSMVFNGVDGLVALVRAF